MRGLKIARLILVIAVIILQPSVAFGLERTLDLNSIGVDSDILIHAPNTSVEIGFPVPRLAKLTSATATILLTPNEQNNDNNVLSFYCNEKLIGSRPVKELLRNNSVTLPLPIDDTIREKVQLKIKSNSLNGDDTSKWFFTIHRNTKVKMTYDLLPIQTVSDFFGTAHQQMLVVLPNEADLTEIGPGAWIYGILRKAYPFLDVQIVRASELPKLPPVPRIWVGVASKLPPYFSKTKAGIALADSNTLLISANDGYGLRENIQKLLKLAVLPKTQAVDQSASTWQKQNAASIVMDNNKTVQTSEGKGVIPAEFQFFPGLLTQLPERVGLHIEGTFTVDPAQKVRMDIFVNNSLIDSTMLDQTGKFSRDIMMPQFIEILARNNVQVKVDYFPNAQTSNLQQKTVNISPKSYIWGEGYYRPRQLAWSNVSVFFNRSGTVLIDEALGSDLLKTAGEAAYFLDSQMPNGYFAFPEYLPISAQPDAPPGGYLLVVGLTPNIPMVWQEKVQGVASINSMNFSKKLSPERASVIGQIGVWNQGPLIMLSADLSSGAFVDSLRSVAKYQSLNTLKGNVFIYDNIRTLISFDQDKGDIAKEFIRDMIGKLPLPPPAIYEALYLFMLFVAAVIFVSGIDDAFIDIIYWVRKIYRSWFVLPQKFKHIDMKQLSDKEEKSIAIMVPAWDEANVIASMLSANIEIVHYTKYRFFVGAYQNDRATIDEVRRMAQNYTNIQTVIVPHDGPTCKADCLNWIIQAIYLYESQQNMTFAGIVMHDSEDLIHPLELQLYNWLLPRVGLIQIPVRSFECKWNDFVAGTYLDEFAECHCKDMVVREVLGQIVPSAGVATCFSREAMEFLTSENRNEPFNTGTLTEDYDISFRLSSVGVKQIFVTFPVEFKLTRQNIKGELVKITKKIPIAVSEYFPSDFNAAVRQKSRWIIGIALQGWTIQSWEGSWTKKYFFVRDRKGLAVHIISLVAYAMLLLYFALWLGAKYGEWPAFEYALPTWLLVANTILLLNRLIQRMYFVWLSYNWLQAFLVIPRVAVCNVVNFFATVRAIRRYIDAAVHNKALTWEKTSHVFPNTEQLAKAHKRLGEYLLDQKIVDVNLLERALQLSRKSHKPLGKVLIEGGHVDENLITDIICQQTGYPRARIETEKINNIPGFANSISTKYRVMPLNINNLGKMRLAVTGLLSPEVRIELKKITGYDISPAIVSDGEMEELYRIQRKSSEVMISQKAGEKRKVVRKAVLISSIVCLIGLFMPLKAAAYQATPLFGEGFQHAKQAYTLYASGQFSEMEIAVHKALKYYPEHPRLLLLLAQAAQQRGNNNSAFEIIAEINQKHPEFAQAIALRGTLFTKTGKHSEALVYFKKTLQLSDKENVDRESIRLSLIDSAIRSAQPEVAVEYLQRQDAYWLRVQVVRSLIEKSNLALAAKVLDDTPAEGLPIVSAAERGYLRAVILEKTGRESEAKTIYDQVLKQVQSGSSPFLKSEILWNFAEKAEKNGNVSEAIKLGLAAVNAWPESTSRRLQFAYMAKRLKRIPLAIEHMEYAIQHSQEPVPASVLRDIAYDLKKIGDNKRAMKYFALSIDSTPANGKLSNNEQKKTIEMNYDIRREHETLERKWGMYTSLTYWNPGNADAVLQASTEVYWLVYNKNGRKLALFNRYYGNLWSQTPNSSGPYGWSSYGWDTAQGGIGVNWKPLTDANLILTVEKQFPVGRQGVSEVLYRVGYSLDQGYEFKPYVKSWPYTTLYIEYDYWTSAMRSAINMEMRWGRSTRLGDMRSRDVFTPHVFLTANYDSGYLANANQPTWAMATGVGFVYRHWYREDKYNAPRSYWDWTVQYRMSIGGRRMDGLLMQLYNSY